MTIKHGISKAFYVSPDKDFYYRIECFCGYHITGTTRYTTVAAFAIKHLEQHGYRTYVTPPRHGKLQAFKRLLKRGN